MTTWISRGRLFCTGVVFSGVVADELLWTGAITIGAIAAIAAIHLSRTATVISTATRHLGALIMTSQQATVDAITAQLTKVKAEVVGTRDALLDQIKALKDEIAAGTEAAQLDLSGLETVAADLDALTPDSADLTDNVSGSITDNVSATITDSAGASLTDNVSADLTDTAG